MWYRVVVDIFSICSPGCTSVLYFIKAQQCQQQLIKPEYLNLLYEWSFNSEPNYTLIKFPDHVSLKTTLVIREEQIKECQYTVLSSL